ncbi:hypothetical protein P154DRAFT_557002 [Amniculicola lignicola CBS 123094]|uniref:Uncharacterized protein n=1 Tax=Amniculicola lignicola CBS 123094 TaxID=1392246 RepID=A0A6A5VZ33_9PLEO|nr:hypothetical protein P154DRAFT_557002 [Amniculicola lignicola CBS 123094]
MFKPLSTAYLAELLRYLQIGQGLALFKESTILNSFKSTGISLPNPDPILNRFTYNQESGNSSLSGLSDYDWRKMDRLAKKLSHSVYYLSVQNELLRHEIDRIKQVLATKQKQTAELRKAAKLYKEKIQQEKHTAREAAKEAREKERAKKAAQRAAQKSARNAEKALQLSQKGKRKASQPSLQSRKRQKRVVDAADATEVLEGASAAPTISTRHGRNVNHPNRYR